MRPLEETGANEELELSVSFGAEQYNTLSISVVRRGVAVVVAVGRGRSAGRSATSNNFSNRSPTETLSKLRRGKLSPAGGGAGGWATYPTTNREGKICRGSE